MGSENLVDAIENILAEIYKASGANCEYTLVTTGGTLPLVRFAYQPEPGEYIHSDHFRVEQIFVKDACKTAFEVMKQLDRAYDVYWAIKRDKESGNV